MRGHLGHLEIGAHRQPRRKISETRRFLGSILLGSRRENNIMARHNPPDSNHEAWPPLLDVGLDRAAGSERPGHPRGTQLWATRFPGTAIAAPATIASTTAALATAAPVTAAPTTDAPTTVT